MLAAQRVPSCHCRHIFKDMVRLCKPGGVVGVMSINTPNTPAGNVGG
jgi:hypothetical protein